MKNKTIKVGVFEFSENSEKVKIHLEEPPIKEDSKKKQEEKKNKKYF